jgi:hypothetical protein
MPPPIPRQAEHQFGVFTIAQASEAGWSPPALRHGLRTERLIRLRRGAFAVREATESGRELDRLRLGQRGVAAALRIPAATVSHASAVALYGLPLLITPRLPCVTLPPELRTREAALHVHRQPLPSWQLDRARGVSITSVARSCIDLTRESGLASGLVAADAAVHRGLCTKTDLVAVYERLRGRAGLSCGRQLVELVDGSSESPLESISRLGMVGFQPAPHTQVSLRTGHGQFLARVDFYWPGLGVVGEADGRVKYTDDELWNEKARQERLTDSGLVVERWGWSVARQPTVLQARLRRAFRRAAMLRSAGIAVEVRPG